MADEHVTIGAPSVHDLLHLAYLPIVQLHEPKQTLASDAAQHLSAKMREIIGYLHSDHLQFADTPSFSKFFSRLSGMSPKEYRKGLRTFLIFAQYKVVGSGSKN